VLCATIDGMAPRRTSGLVLAPLLVLATLAAHQLAYLGATAPAAGAHGYLSAAPGVAGVAVLALAVALGLRVVGASRGAAVRSPGAALGLVPVAGFLLQEVTERLVAGAAVGASLAGQRPILVGVAIQLLFGLAALRLCRVLVDGAELLGRLVAGPRRAAAAVALARPAAPVALVAAAPLSRRLAGRAPPVPA
jgi:hypothetical protein